MKRLFILLFTLLIAFSFLSLSVPAAQTQSAVSGAAGELASTGFSIPSEGDFLKKLNQLRVKYPDGDIWEGVYYEDGSAKAWTCFAYAVQLMHEIFGVKYYAERIYDYIDYDFDGIRAGDMVRIDGNSHSILITKVTSKGFGFTDGNGTGIYNQVRWDGFYSTEELKNRFTYKVHLPGNSLKGTGTLHTVAYNANGGTGKLSSQSVSPAGKFKLKSNGFTRSGYQFAGYSVKRSCDNKWFTTDAGWQPLSSVYDNGYRLKIYPQGNTYKLNNAWIGGVSKKTAFTFYAEWLPVKSTVEFIANYSGYNYLPGSDLGKNCGDFIFPRDKAVYTTSVDQKTRLNNAASLKIVGKKAGSKASDVAILTSTNKGYGNGYSPAGKIGDDQKSFTLRFYAKAGVNGAKMILRWSYANKTKSVTLTKSWKLYSVTLPKTNYYGPVIHLYLNQAGTYYLNSLTLSDAGSASNIAPEGAYHATANRTVKRGSALSELPAVKRKGYIFMGWYTATEGGSKVTESTRITKSTVRLYAHWRKSISQKPVKTVSFKGHVYELYDNSLKWSDAADFCKAKGGHLVTVGSEAENKTVYGMIKGRQQLCWIGLRYQPAKKSWKWVDSTKLGSYHKWFDSADANKDNGEHYALMYPMNFMNKSFASKWDKCKENARFSSYYSYLNSCFICEYDKPKT